MTGPWLTLAEYARRHGVTSEAVRQAANAGRLETNGKTGRDRRVRGLMAGSASSPAAEDGSSTPLVEARLEKLRADVELQRQRIRENVDEARRAYIELVLEEYVRAFSPFKARLAELRLSASQLTKLRKLVDDCLQAFTDGVEKRLNE